MLAKPATAANGDKLGLLVFVVFVVDLNHEVAPFYNLGRATRAGVGLEFGDDFVERDHQEHSLTGTPQR